MRLSHWSQPDSHAARSHPKSRLAASAGISAQGNAQLSGLMEHLGAAAKIALSWGPPGVCPKLQTIAARAPSPVASSAPVPALVASCS
jgi:hypothetical protein